MPAELLQTGPNVPERRCRTSRLACKGRCGCLSLTSFEWRIRKGSLVQDRARQMQYRGGATLLALLTEARKRFRRWHMSRGKSLNPLDEFFRICLGAFIPGYSKVIPEL